jgi:hypothetical protein
LVVCTVYRIVQGSHKDVHSFQFAYPTIRRSDSAGMEIPCLLTKPEENIEVKGREKAHVSNGIENQMNVSNIAKQICKQSAKINSPREG